MMPLTHFSNTISLTMASLSLYPGVPVVGSYSKASYRVTGTILVVASFVHTTIIYLAISKQLLSVCTKSKWICEKGLWDNILMACRTQGGKLITY